MRETAAVLATLFMCSALAQAQGVARVLGCYSLTWSDSLNSSANRRYYNLPLAFRLEAQEDTSLHQRMPPSFVVTLLGTTPDSFPEPPRASWQLIGRDSVNISMRGWPPIHWELLLVARRDSLTGRVWGTVGDGVVGLTPSMRRASRENRRAPNKRLKLTSPRN